MRLFRYNWKRFGMETKWNSIRTCFFQIDEQKISIVRRKLFEPVSCRIIKSKLYLNKILYTVSTQWWEPLFLAFLYSAIVKLLNKPLWESISNCARVKRSSSKCDRLGNSVAVTDVTWIKSEIFLDLLISNLC